MSASSSVIDDGPVRGDGSGPAGGNKLEGDCSDLFGGRGSIVFSTIEISAGRGDQAHDFSMTGVSLRGDGLESRDGGSDKACHGTPHLHTGGTRSRTRNCHPTLSRQVLRKFCALSSNLVTDSMPVVKPAMVGLVHIQERGRGLLGFRGSGKAPEGQHRCLRTMRWGVWDWGMGTVTSVLWSALPVTYTLPEREGVRHDGGRGTGETRVPPATCRMRSWERWTWRLDFLRSTHRLAYQLACNSNSTQFFPTLYSSPNLCGHHAWGRSQVKEVKAQAISDPLHMWLQVHDAFDYRRS